MLADNETTTAAPMHPANDGGDATTTTTSSSGVGGVVENDEQVEAPVSADGSSSTAVAAADSHLEKADIGDRGDYAADVPSSDLAAAAAAPATNDDTTDLDSSADSDTSSSSSDASVASARSAVDPSAIVIDDIPTSPQDDGIVATRTANKVARAKLLHKQSMGGGGGDEATNRKLAFIRSVSTRGGGTPNAAGGMAMLSSTSPVNGAAAEPPHTTAAEKSKPPPVDVDKSLDEIYSSSSDESSDDDEEGGDRFDEQDTLNVSNVSSDSAASPHASYINRHYATAQPSSSSSAQTLTADALSALPHTSVSAADGSSSAAAAAVDDDDDAASVATALSTRTGLWSTHGSIWGDGENSVVTAPISNVTPKADKDKAKEAKKEAPAAQEEKKGEDGEAVSSSAPPMMSVDNASSAAAGAAGAAAHRDDTAEEIEASKPNKQAAGKKLVAGVWSALRDRVTSSKKDREGEEGAVTSEETKGNAPPAAAAADVGSPSPTKADGNDDGASVEEAAAGDSDANMDSASGLPRVWSIWNETEEKKGDDDDEDEEDAKVAEGPKDDAATTKDEEGASEDVQDASEAAKAASGKKLVGVLSVLQKKVSNVSPMKKKTNSTEEVVSPPADTVADAGAARTVGSTATEVAKDDSSTIDAENDGASSEAATANAKSGVWSIWQEEGVSNDTCPTSEVAKNAAAAVATADSSEHGASPDNGLASGEGKGVTDSASLVAKSGDDNAEASDTAASAMSGKLSGVLSVLREKASNASPVKLKKIVSFPVTDPSEENESPTIGAGNQNVDGAAAQATSAKSGSVYSGVWSMWRNNEQAATDGADSKGAIVSASTEGGSREATAEQAYPMANASEGGSAVENGSKGVANNKSPIFSTNLMMMDTTDVDVAAVKPDDVASSESHGASSCTATMSGAVSSTNMIGAGLIAESTTCSPVASEGEQQTTVLKSQSAEDNDTKSLSTIAEDGILLDSMESGKMDTVGTCLNPEKASETKAVKRADSSPTTVISDGSFFMYESTSNGSEESDSWAENDNTFRRKYLSRRCVIAVAIVACLAIVCGAAVGSRREGTTESLSGTKSLGATFEPSMGPTEKPSQKPSQKPTREKRPQTKDPTQKPTVEPTLGPTLTPLSPNLPEGFVFIREIRGPRGQSCADGRKRILDKPLVTDKIRIEIASYENWPSLRVGVNDANGMVEIKSWRASSAFDSSCAAENAAITSDNGCESGLSWCAESPRIADFLEIEFPRLTTITSFTFEGRYTGEQWGLVKTMNLYAAPGPPTPTPQPSFSPTSQPSLSPTNPPTTGRASPTVQPTTEEYAERYIPGNLTQMKLGVLLSTGLDVAIIAEKNTNVKFAGGGTSSRVFHERPDFGDTFSVPESDTSNPGGWVYVGNSEMDLGTGGVGAVTFNAKGQVVDYRMLQRGTTRNCGGGRTPWDTWVSCEEPRGTRTGQCWEMDPFGKNEPRQTVLGRNGGIFESFAFDVRDRQKPRFFVTEDDDYGALRRFTPTNPDWNDPSDMLHGDGNFDYLVLTPQNQQGGRFEWVPQLRLARQNAFQYYRNSEGIDSNGEGQLYFVSKKNKDLFILDLDGGTYTKHSTVHGNFDGDPDQMKRVIGEDEILYFTENGGEDAGIHGRDSQGRYFTILESPVYKEETTGLSFSPDHMHMYMAYQMNGLLLDIWRKDGLPFTGKTFNIQYHKTDAE